MEAALEKMLRALLAGSFEAVDEYVYEVEWESGTGLLNAAFWLAVNRRFDVHSTLRTIQVYVSEAHHEYPNLDTSIAEVLIRAARGEEHLIDGLDPASALPVEMVLLHKLVVDERLSEAQFEDFIADSFRLAEQTAG
jgi:hypothetical protein